MMYRIALPLLAACLASTTLPARAETPLSVYETRVVETVLGVDSGAGTGTFRARSQTIFSPHSQEPERRLYEVFDLHPARDLDFTWAADDLSADRPGRISGTGRLVWRLKDSPTYDDAAIVSTFRGAMKGGMPHGAGLYATREGLVYDGQWRNGRPHGAGRLILPNGEEYVGTFRNGLAEGRGTFTETTWERFEGTFSRGLRDGAGKTTLPSGLAYESQWRLGRETPNSLRIRIAQVGAAPAIGGTDDVKMGITMDRRPKLPQEIKPKEVLLYAARSTPNGLIVEPDDKQMLAAWRGTGDLATSANGGMNPRTGYFLIEDDYVQPANFRLDFQNKAKQAIEVQSLQLVVRESMTENRPAIDLLMSFDPSCGTSFKTDLTLYNSGWAKARNGKFDVGFVAGGAKEKPASTPYSVPVNDLDQMKELDVVRAVVRAGAKVNVLKAVAKAGGFPCPGGDKQACLADLQRNPSFGTLGPLLRLDDTTLYVQMKGTYSYLWTDAKGNEQRGNSLVNVKIGLGNLPVQAECGAGGPPEVIRTKPIKLRLDAENYTIPVPFRRAIPPGRSANFMLSLDADKSSNHDLEIVAKLSDGREIKSPPIKLLYYKPKPITTN